MGIARLKSGRVYSKLCLHTPATAVQCELGWGTGDNLKVGACPLPLPLASPERAAILFIIRFSNNSKVFRASDVDGKI